MSFSGLEIGKYVFSQDEQYHIIPWQITDIFEDNYAVIQNVITKERKCCFQFYDLQIYDTADKANYPIEEIMAGLAEVQDLEDVLDINRECTYGWLAPNGKFYACRRGAHDRVARIYFQLSELQLENRGWCKVLDDYFLICTRKMSQEQLRWLTQHNIEVDEDDYDIY